MSPAQPIPDGAGAVVSVGDVVDIVTDAITGPQPAAGVLVDDRYAAHGQPEAVQFPRRVQQAPVDAAADTAASSQRGSPPASTASGSVAAEPAGAVMAYRWQFCGGDDEASADEVRAWDGAHGDTCIVAVTRTRRGRWRIVSSDYPLPVSGYDRRFAAPLDAVEYMAGRARRAAVPAVCRCRQTSAAACD